MVLINHRGWESSHPNPAEGILQVELSVEKLPAKPTAAVSSCAGSQEAPGWGGLQKASAAKAELKTWECLSG